MSASEGVQAKLTAVQQLGAGVLAFGRQAHQAGDQAIASAQQLARDASNEHERRVAQVREAKAAKGAAAAALRACTENCAPLQRALAEAETAERAAVERADRSAKAIAQVGEAIRDFGGARRSFETALEEHIPRAKNSTEEVSSHMQRYLGSGTGSAPAKDSGGGQSLGSSRQPSSTNGGMEDVSLLKVINDRRGTLSFEKVSRDHVAWGLDRLKTVVEPALRMGKGADYFAARDAAEGLAGEHSYSGVYNWFYNSDHAIKLTRASGGFVVANGYHRLAVARDLGIDSLPAVIR